MSDEISRFTIFQVGDVHFPSVRRNMPSVDIKDSGFPDPTVFRGANSRIEIVAEKLSRLAKQSADACVFMGDLTTNGEIKGLRDCVDYISNGITNYIFTKDEIAKKVLFVPGNHDVERPKKVTKDFQRDVHRKFKNYYQTLKTQGFNKTSVEGVDTIEISKSGNSVSIMGINTCIGCGELRILPDSVRKQVNDSIIELFSEFGADRDLNEINANFVPMLNERVDAPVIDERTLSELSLHIDKVCHTDSCIPVVVGHHNLLPQAIPRVATYSEMVNSGRLRSMLKASNTPIIYLHGHIHDDPIEVISSIESNDCGIISISAPLFEKGFNVIEIFLGGSGVPLGVCVDPHRYDTNGQRKRLPKRRIPFQFGKFRLANTSKLARKLFEYLASEKSCYFTDIVDYFKDEERSAIVSSIIELEWLGSIEVRNQDHEASKWQISVAL